MIAGILILAQENAVFGIPSETDFVIDRKGFSLGYSKQFGQPLWVVYKLTKENVETKNAVRNNKFKADPLLKDFSPLPDDYRETGYDRGHLAPAADMAYTVITMDNSFFMSNISPQTPKFNRGIWSRLEKQVRDFALTENEIYVITGPVFKNDDTHLISIGKNNPIIVPYAYYKVIYDLTPPQKMIAFIIPNTGSKKSLAQFAVTVSTVEQMTGLEFFPNLSEEKKKSLEATISITDWSWTGDKK